MENWLVILIAVVGASGVLIPYYIVTKRREKSGGDEKTGDKSPTTLCRVYNNETRRVSNENLTEDDVKKIRDKHTTLGRKWLRDGKWVYALNKLVGGEYVPVSIPQTMEDPPSSLHRALLQDAVGIFYDVSPEKGFFQEHGKILLFVGSVLFLLWTVIMN